ncbi:MAG: flavin reductase family protein [Anaerolineaceae bacterium]|nr:flavin reductase family protein [Anaerolineaceae bacterium]
MKIQFGQVPLVYAVPIALAGVCVDSEPNYITLGDVGIMGINPALVYISTHQNHYSTGGLEENQTFSVNFPTTNMLAETDYCGIVSGRDVDKAVLFETFYGELKTAPMISECPVNLECKVVKDFTIEHRHIFIGEVRQAYVEETFIEEKDGRKVIADLTRLDPILYALDNRYYRIGEPIGKGYSEGRKIQLPNRHEKKSLD